ncbi:MAG: hypothetical protein ABL985_00680 [Casimicrobium sp.]
MDYAEWGDRITSIDVSDVELAPCDKTALEIVNEIRVARDIHGRSSAGLAAAYYVDKKPYGAK